MNKFIALVLIVISFFAVSNNAAASNQQFFTNYAGHRVVLETASAEFLRYKPNMRRWYSGCKVVPRKTFYKKAHVMYDRYVESGLMCKANGKTTYIAVVR